MDNQIGIPPIQNEITKDEKTLALFSHLSLFLGGILLPIIFWATNKDKSKFVAFHSLQSVWFHVAYIFIFVFLMVFLVIGGAGMGMAFGMTKTHGAGKDSPLFVLMMIAFYGGIFVVVFAGIIYAVVMGLKAHKGEFCKYPIIGNMVYKHIYGDKVV